MPIKGQIVVTGKTVAELIEALSQIDGQHRISSVDYDFYTYEWKEYVVASLTIDVSPEP